MTAGSKDCVRVCEGWKLEVKMLIHFKIFTAIQDISIRRDVEHGEKEVTV